MNGFQIRSGFGVALTIGQLDQEVCDIVGLPGDPKLYCPLGHRNAGETFSDFTMRCPNWYDSIGWEIAHKGYSFQEYLDSLSEGWVKPYLGTIDNGNIVTVDYVFPMHIAVVKSWIEKGYTAHSIPE